MKSNFSTQELNERLLDLLYGLVDEDEAEELRRLVASDSDAARAFDEARETAGLLARAARAEIDENVPIRETARNVAVDPLASTFAFDAAVGAFGKGVFQPKSNDAQLDETAPNAETKEERKNRKKREKTEKKNAKNAAKSRKMFSENAIVDVESSGDWATVGRTPNATSRTVENRALFTGVSNVPGRAWRTFGSLSLFQKLNVAFAALGLAMLVGFASQEFQLRKRFQEDFRVQLAAPPVLARGVPQTITATTTGPNGKPRRVPLRFCFTDAKTGKLLLAHTESGDASGVAKFDVPDVSSFPEQTRLTISVGERDAKTVETLETILPVVDGSVPRRAAANEFDAPKMAAAPARIESDSSVFSKNTESDDARNRQNAAFSKARAAQAPSTFEMAMDGGEMGGGETGASSAYFNAESSDAAPTFSEPDRAFSNNVNKGNNNDNEIADYVDRAVESVPATAAAPSFARAASTQAFVESRLSGPPSDANLKEETSEEPILSNAESVAVQADAPTLAETAVFAASAPETSVRFFPEGGRLVAGFENRVWFSCVDSTGAPVAGTFELKKSVELPEPSTAQAETTADSAKIAASGAGKTRVLSAETSENGIGSFALTPELGETYSLERVDSNADADATAESRRLADSSNDVAASELPAAVARRVVFSAFSKVVPPGAPLSLDVETNEKTPLAATVEKNGVVVAQTVWTANEGRRRVALSVPANVSGVLIVSVYLCERTPLEKIGETAFYRKSAATPTLDAKILRDADGAKTLNVRSIEPNVDVSARGRDRVVREEILDETPEKSKKSKSVRLDVVWAPTRNAATAFLSDDEALAEAPDSTKEDFLGTFDANARSIVPPPIIFDNLIGMKKRVLSKLTDFWQIETRFASNVVRFGFFGCVVLSGLTIFFVVFRALSLGRGAIVVGCCCALATFFQFERKTIDFSSALSKSIAFSVAEEEKSADVQNAASSDVVDDEKTKSGDSARNGARNPAFSEEFRANWSRSAATSNAVEADSVSTTRVVFSRSLPLGDSFDLQLDDALTSDETKTGVLLVKIVRNDAQNGAESRWTILNVDDRETDR